MVAVLSGVTVPSASTVTSTLPVEAATARTGIGRPASALRPPGPPADWLPGFMAQAITATSTAAATAVKMRRRRRASRACPWAVVSRGTGSGVIGASRLTPRTMAQLHLPPQARPARQKNCGGAQEHPATPGGERHVGTGVGLLV